MNFSHSPTWPCSHLCVKNKWKPHDTRPQFVCQNQKWSLWQRFSFQVNPALSHCVCRAQEGCVKKGKEPGIKAVEYWSKSKLWAAVNWNNRDWGEQHLSMTDLQCLSFCSISKRKNLSFNTHQLLTCYWYSSCGALCIADGVVTLSRKPRALGEEHGQVLYFSLFGSAGRVRSLRQSWSNQELKSLCWRNWWAFAWSQRSFMLSGMV